MPLRTRFNGPNLIARGGLGLALILAAIPAAAQSNIQNACDIIKLVRVAASWFGLFVFIIAVITILYAALLFLLSGGNEETIKKARNVLVWGLVGIAVALSALNAVPFVQSIIGGTPPSGC